MPARTLTEAFACKVRPIVGQKHQIDYYDSRVSGLCLRVSPTGAKTFCVTFRSLGRGKRVTIGRYPIVGLAAARKRALQVLSSYDTAQSYGGSETLVDNRLKVSELVADYMEKHAKKKTRSWRETERLLRQNLVKRFGSLRCCSVTQNDVHRMVETIGARAPSEANHVFVVTRALFNWGIRTGAIVNNPCRNLSLPYATQSRERTLSDDELRAVWHAAEEMGYPYGTVIKLLILTGQRRGEVVGMRWEELDLQGARWIIPAERNKSNRTHEIPLSQIAVRLLGEVEKYHNELVFPNSADTGTISGFSKWKARLSGLAGVHDWKVHDLRRTFATGIASLGNSPVHVIERLINHQTGELSPLAKVYNRFNYMSDMRVAVEGWAEHVSRVVTDRPRIGAEQD